MRFGWWSLSFPVRGLKPFRLLPVMGLTSPMSWPVTGSTISAGAPVAGSRAWFAALPAPGWVGPWELGDGSFGGGIRLCKEWGMG